MDKNQINATGSVPGAGKTVCRGGVLLRYYRLRHSDSCLRTCHLRNQTWLRSCIHQVVEHGYMLRKLPSSTAVAAKKCNPNLYRLRPNIYPNSSWFCSTSGYALELFEPCNVASPTTKPFIPTWQFRH